MASCKEYKGPTLEYSCLNEGYALDIMNKGAGALDIDHLTAVIHEIFFGGTETSSTTIQWFLACMASHPDIQEKLFQEVHAVVGEGTLCLNHLKELKYLQVIFCSSQS